MIYDLKIDTYYHVYAYDHQLITIDDKESPKSIICIYGKFIERDTPYLVFNLVEYIEENGEKCYRSDSFRVLENTITNIHEVIKLQKVEKEVE